MLNIEEENLKKWDGCEETKLKAGHKINQPEIIFTKIDDKLIEPYLKSQEKTSQQKSEEQKSEQQKLSVNENKIDINDFKKIEICVAEILECELIPNSKTFEVES